MEKKKKLKIYAAIVFVLLLIGLTAFLLSGGNIEILKEVFREDATREEVRESLSRFGVKGYITLGILSMLQVVFTFLPAEPVQVISGISFGFLRGSLVCFCGVVMGNTVIYILYKIYGDRLSEFFQSNVEFDFERARRSPKIAIIVFILYFLPAIPYGMICLFSASLGIKYPKYIALTAIGSIPSILIGVGLGHMAMATSWIISVVVFLALLALLVILFKNKSKVFAKVNEFMKKREQGRGGLKEANPILLGTLVLGSRVLYCTRIKVRIKNEIARLERPSIVLCSHGSFIDFVYLGRILRKEKPHVVMARLYSYHKWLHKLTSALGCVPKSMFTVDIENAKACMRVLSHEGVLAMMPEARLSTVGKYEGVQDSTYSFLQRTGVTVYAMRLSGDYFANPKWGEGVRHHSYVEAELTKLFDAGETKELSFEEIKKRVDEALYYDEFAWLESKPNIHYKTKKMAQGLENILCICPKCGAKYTLKTKGDTLACESCGMSARIDDRYAFVDEKPFKNFKLWYEWQAEQLRAEILQDPNYKLESKVELRHGSTDGKTLTRHAGEGVCVLDRTGLTYKGEEDGKQIEKLFPLSQIYRLLFGAGQDFEIYEGKEIWYFVPEDKRSCVAWYVVSGLLKEIEEA